jgi:diguanylate cyclase (GGDEF)-like protein
MSVVFSIGPVIIFGALFSSNFLKLATIRPRLNKLVLSFVWVSIAYSIATILLPYVIMIRIGATLAIVTAAIAMFSTIQEWCRSRSREIMMFIIAWSTVLVGFLLYSGQKFGLLPINALTEHAIEIGAVLEVLLLALGLADRINSERKARIETQQRLLDIQIQANQELDNKVRERTEELEVLNDHLQTASITDSLTQVKNRHYFDRKLPGEYRRAYREKSWISLVIIDIDHFKLFNDNYGHQAGDAVLQAVASTIQDVVKRPSDAVTRYGGEEFTVLLPNTPQEGAYQVAERIRKNIEALQVDWKGEPLSVTASLGLACCIPSHHEGESMLLKQADDFLYVAKEHGRNRVVYEVNDPTSLNE